MDGTMYKKLLLTLFATALCLTLSAKQQDALYLTLGEKILEAYDQVAAEKKDTSLFDAPKIESKEEKEKKVDTSIYHFSDHEKLQLSIKLLDAKSSTLLPKSYFCRLEELEKLSVFKGTGSDKKANLLNIFTTKTSFGKIMAAELLVTAPYSYKEIVERQKSVKLFAENKQLLEKALQAVTKIGENESLHHTFYKHDENFEKAVSTLAMKGLGSWFNLNPLVLQTAHIFRTINYVTSLSPTIVALCAFGAPYYIEANIKEKLNSTTKKVAHGIGFALGSIMYGFTVQDIYAQFIQMRSIVTNLQQRTTAIATIVRNMKEVYKLSKQYPELLSALPEMSALTTLFEQKNDTNLQYLLELLEAKTFDGQLSYFSNVGKIFVAYQLIHEKKEALVPALQAIGKLDALCSAAELVTTRTDDTPYCFVKFVNSAQPLMHITNGRHPLIPTQAVVKHTVNIGSTDKNLHIAGPNGSGKSVVISEIADWTIMAHAFGIIPAEKATMSVFTGGLHVYLGVQEDLSRNLSTYMAQQHRFEEIMFMAERAHEKRKVALIVMDEPLTGASPSIAGPRVHDDGLKLASYPTVCTVLASHFAESSTLERDSNGTFSTYYLGLKPHGFRSFTRTFNLERGQHPWWNIDTELTKQYLFWLETQSIK